MEDAKKCITSLTILVYIAHQVIFLAKELDFALNVLMVALIVTLLIALDARLTTFISLG